MGEVNRNTLKTYFNRGDRPTESQFVDLVDSNLNLVNESDRILQSVSSGDAGKITRIKTDESGWENYDDIIIGESSTVIQIKGTLEDLFRHNASDIDPDGTTFGLTVTTTDFPGQTRDDIVYNFGYNLDNAGSIDPTDHSFGLQFESYFVETTWPQWEWFLRSDDINGNKLRPLFFKGPIDETDSGAQYLGAVKVDIFNFYKREDQRIKIDFELDRFIIFEGAGGTGLPIFNQANDTWLLQQYNAAQDTITNIIKLNSNDIIEFGAETRLAFDVTMNQILGTGETLKIGKDNTGEGTALQVIGNDADVIRIDYEGYTGNAWYLAVNGGRFELHDTTGAFRPFKVFDQAPDDSLVINTDGSVDMNNLPTTNPGGSGKLWNDAGTVKIT